MTSSIPRMRIRKSGSIIDDGRFEFDVNARQASTSALQVIKGE